MLPIPAKLCVHSASTLGRQDINSGDKIILSPQVLMSCEQQELSYPIVSVESLEWNMGMEFTVLNLIQHIEENNFNFEKHVFLVKVVNRSYMYINIVRIR